VDGLPRAVARVDTGSAAAALLGFGVVVGLAAADGGYWPTAWSWTGLVLGWAALVVLLLRLAAPLGHDDLVLLAGFGAFVGWIGLSALWSDSIPRTMLELQRGLGYLALLLAVLVVVRRQSYRALVAGTWTGITVMAAYGLATRLLPGRLGVYDPVAGYRLAEPLGYWNALGIFSALGALLALGLAASSGRWLRAAAAASLVVLLPTLYFTFSRGAWIALGAGLVATFALEPRRLRLGAVTLALLPSAGMAVALAYGSEALTRPASSLEAATREGHRLVLLVAALAVVNAALALLLSSVEPRVRSTTAQRRALGGAVAVVAAASAVWALSTYGSPARIVSDAYDAFVAPSPSARGDLNERLFSFSGSGRADLWRVAWDGFRERETVGSGAGTYELEWLRSRPYPQKVRDAHNLYLETMTELGVVGLALLVVALTVPLAAGARARRSPLVPVAAGALVAFLIHAAVDWDWEMSAVTATALLCAGALVGAARRASRTPRAVTVGMGVVAALVALVSFAGVVGYTALADAERAAAASRADEVERHARRAERWLPASAQPLRYVGIAQLARGERDAARVTLGRAVERDPLDWELWVSLATASDGSARARAVRQVERLNPLAPQLDALRSTDATGRDES
jgi:hypothetical protein